MKPLLILIHGVARTSRMWAPHLPLLQPQVDVIAPDLPGFGVTTGPFRFDEAVAQVAADLDAGLGTGGGRTAYVCGDSAGAMVALRLAVRRPEAVTGLIVSGVQVHPPRVLLALQGVFMRAIPAARYSEDDPGVTKESVLTAVRELGRVDLRPDLAAVRARTLVVCGEQDRANLSAARRAAAGIAGAQLRVQPDAGHLWSEAEPEAFSRMLLDWAVPS